MTIGEIRTANLKIMNKRTNLDMTLRKNTMNDTRDQEHGTSSSMRTRTAVCFCREKTATKGVDDRMTSVSCCEGVTRVIQIRD